MNAKKILQVKTDENVLVQELDDEAVLLNLTDEHYFGLDEIGLRFWQLLETHGNTNDVVAILKTEYDAPEDTLHTDLGKFVVELETAGLLSIVDA